MIEIKLSEIEKIMDICNTKKKGFIAFYSKGEWVYMRTLKEYYDKHAYAQEVIDINVMVDMYKNNILITHFKIISE